MRRVQVKKKKIRFFFFKRDLGARATTGLHFPRAAAPVSEARALPIVPQPPNDTDCLDGLGHSFEISVIEK